MVIINPVPLPPFGGHAYTNITPFTYRDGWTFQRVLEELRKYIRDVLVPHVDGAFDELEAYVNSAIADSAEWTSEQISTLTTYVNEQVALIINNSVEVQDAVVAGIFDDELSATRTITDTVYAPHSVVDVIETGRLSESSLEAKFEPVFSVSARDFGIVMDGVTDDTAAWQTLFNTVPRGTTVILPPSDSGASWSLIKDTIVVTTESIKLVGPSSYHYNGGLVFEGVNRAMFVIKASGFQIENVGVIGRSVNGIDPVYGYQIGFDYYGGVLGDIDAQMHNCAIVSMGTAVRTNGRNLTIQNTLFSDNAIDWDQAPKNSSYHDVTQRNIIRGLIARNNRHHTSGTTNTPCIYIHDHVDYRHGVIEGNYFDNNCEGVAVKAVGTTTIPVRGLTIANNRVYEAVNGLCVLDYCDTPFINGNELYGTGSSLYVFDAITVSNSPGVVIMGNLLTRTGGHGIKASTCSDIAILNNRMSIVGGSGATGDGVNWTTDCTRGRIDGLSIAGAVGSGIVGKPSQSSVSGLNIRSTGKPLNGPTPAMSTVTPEAMHITAGTPTIGSINFTAAYMIDPSVAEGVSAIITPPPGATTVALECLYTGMAAGSGSAVIQLSYTPPGTPLTTPQVGTSPAFVVPETSGELAIAKAFEIDATSGPIPVRVTRIANNASDTYPNDIGIVAIRLVQIF